MKFDVLTKPGSGQTEQKENSTKSETCRFVSFRFTQCHMQVPGVEGGGYSDHVLIAPAYIATEAEIDEIIEKLRLALADVFSEPDVLAAMQ